MGKIYRVWTSYGKNANKWVSTDWVEEDALNLYINEITERLRSHNWTKRITFCIDNAGERKTIIIE